MKNNSTAESSFDAGIAALFNAFRYIFAALAAVIVILIIWYFTFGGAFTVEQHERVLVMNFGKLEKKIYTPGWHWNWPYPVSKIIRVPGPENIQSVSTRAFWFYVEPGKDEMQGSANLTPGKDGYLLTGDANIIHGVWQMDYRINNAISYYTKSMVPDDPAKPDKLLKDSRSGEAIGRRGPRTLLRAVMENTILKVSATRSVDFAWKKPDDYIALIYQELDKAVKKLDMGVEVVRVISLKRTTPPAAARNAFNAVTQAQVKSETEKHEAENYAVQQKNEAEFESAKIIADAETYSINVVESIKSDAKTFKAILKEYRANPETVPVALYSDTLSEVLTSADDIFILRANAKGNQEIRILLNRDPEKSRTPEKDAE